MYGDKIEMIMNDILGIVQIISGLAVIASVVYLAREVSQTSKIVRAQFGHGSRLGSMKDISYPQKIKSFLSFWLKIGLRTVWKIMNIGVLRSG